MSAPVVLFLAIVSEVVATSALKLSNGFTKPVPGLIVVLGYGASFYLLSMALVSMPIGVAYAIWSGVGLVLTVLAGVLVFSESLDWARVSGIVLILAGIVLINVFSKITSH